MTSLRTVGYWRNEQHPEYPDPSHLVDTSWSQDERDEVAAYLRNALVPMAWMGNSPCRICGRDNGSVDFTDGVYIWPEGLVHYVEDHAVRLPREFVSHAMDQLAKYETVERDDGWWISAAGQL